MYFICTSSQSQGVSCSSRLEKLGEGHVDAHARLVHVDQLRPAQYLLYLEIYTEQHDEGARLVILAYYSVRPD